MDACPFHSSFEFFLFFSQKLIKRLALRRHSVWITGPNMRNLSPSMKKKCADSVLSCGLEDHKYSIIFHFILGFYIYLELSSLSVLSL